MVDDIRLSELADTVRSYRQARKIKNLLEQWVEQNDPDEFAQSARRIYDLEDLRARGPKGVALLEEQFPQYKALFAHLRAQYVSEHRVERRYRKDEIDTAHIYHLFSRS